MKNKVIVTGGLGFIGSALVRRLLDKTNSRVLCLDNETYASDRARLGHYCKHERLTLANLDVSDKNVLAEYFRQHNPGLVLHLAAESHVDRSIDHSAPFIQTNVVGTHALLETAYEHWCALDSQQRSNFRFVTVSTDEVFGSLDTNDPPFTEESPYRPNSPYSASKAAADHLARAWHRTYGLPVIISNCSNNYGPYQFPEKLIPLMIIKGLCNEPMPIYGRGDNRRDWLHVEDHVTGLLKVAATGQPGRNYLFGGNCELTNLEVVRSVCDLIDAKLADGRSRRDLITFVDDRPGHDHRYAVDPARSRNELGWAPERNFADGLAETVSWYLNNESWWRSLLENKYGGQRLGLKVAGS